MLVVALALLLAPSPETPAGTAAAPPAVERAPSPETAKKRSQSDLICRDVTPVGTRFSKRVCTSRSDWEERSRRDQEFIRTTRTAPTPNN